MQISEAQENALIELVRSTAKAEIMPRFRQLALDAVKEKTSGQDLVTEADLNAELALTAGIQNILPNAAIIGEEAVAEDASILEQIATAEMAVIIDPIDGTWNYAKGMATFGVIIAITVQAETVLGLLYDPVLDDWIIARKGGGTWFSKPNQPPRRLQLSQDQRTPQQRIAMISPFLFPEEQRRAVAIGALDFERAHTLRCSCHEYRMLAEGVFDFSVAGMERPGMPVALNPWDHAAGVLVVQEAGGVAKLIDGSAYSPALLEGRMFVAHSQHCLEQVQDWYAGLGLEEV